MILLIDNYDSFTYNIFQYLKQLGYDVLVKRNDEISLSDIESLKPSHLILSPGPGRPEDAGITVDVVRTFAGQIPILGICLGHQAIGYAFGGKIIKAKDIYHGKASQIKHDGLGVYQGVDDPFTAIRYHSLVIDRRDVPADLVVTATSLEDGEVMGVRHTHFPVIGLQYHPESIGSTFGHQLLKNFVESTGGI